MRKFRYRPASDSIVVYSRQWPLRLRHGLIAALILLVLLATAGLIRYEHQRGFFSPAWGPDGAVYFIERETRGLLFGIDWQRIDSPNLSWVWKDRVSVRRLDPVGGDLRTLRSWEDTPVAGRLVNAPRDAVFGVLLANLHTSGGLNFTVNISVPDATGFGDDEFARQQKLFLGRGDNVLHNLDEVIAVPGKGFYPAAIVTTVDNREYRMLLQNDEFESLYPDGISAALLEDLSRRESVAKQARILQKRAALTEGYQRQGFDRPEAIRRADQDLAEEGYQVFEPQLIAMRIREPDPGERVFDLPPEELEAGHFSDIAAAIRQPGFPVPKTEEPYSSGAGTAAALNEWLAGGAVSWVIASGDRYYRLLLRY